MTREQAKILKDRYSKEQIEQLSTILDVRILRNILDNWDIFCKFAEDVPMEYAYRYGDSRVEWLDAPEDCVNFDLLCVKGEVYGYGRH